MVGVLVRDEDVAQRGEWYASEGQLASDPVAAIDHVSDVIADDHLRRSGACCPRTRPAPRPEEHEPGDAALGSG